MQLRIGPSRSIIYQPPSQFSGELLKRFSYENSSIKYQLFRHKSNRFKIINRLLHTTALNEADARRIWDEELERLTRAASVSLLYVMDDGNIIFPTGLLNRVIKFFAESGFATEEVIRRDNVVDLRKKPKETQGFPIQAKASDLRPYQKDAVTALVAAGQGTMVAGTGTGKTVVIQELIRRMGLKTVLIVPSISIMRQTVVRFQKYFGRGMIGQFGGGKKLKAKLSPITVVCAPSIAKTEAAMWDEVDVVIADECHHVPCNTIETIFYKVLPRAYYRYGFTATNFRNDGADMAIEAAVFPPVFQYSAEDGIRDGYLAKPKFLMYEVPFNSHKNYTGDLPVFAYKYHILKNDALSRKIIDQINAYVKDGKQVLVLVREKEHGNIIWKGVPGAVFARDSNGEKDGGAPDVDAHDAVQDFNSGKTRCLIGTSMIGEGTDVVPVDVLFNLMGGRSKLEVMQNLGRGLRTTDTKTEVLIVDYIHSTNQMLERHSLERHKIYKKLGPVDIKKL